MPADDRVRLDDDERRAPVPPDVGEQHPQQPIAMPEVGMLDCAPERRQLLTKSHVLKRHGTVSRAE
jgi:hypothetical protein